MNLIVILLLMLLLVVALDFHTVDAEGDPTSSQGARRWLEKASNPRAIGCWNRPWICKQGRPKDFRKRWLCCKNRCVEVTSDVNNCGLCGIRCPFTWQCCGGLCIDTNVNPFHCGNCWTKCHFGSLCFYGMCGYAQPLPPFPFPLPPKHPKPPFPFPFPPKHPKPPVVFPPKPPKGHHHPPPPVA